MSSSKSCSVSILDKLEEIKGYLNDIENGRYSKKEKKLPRYVRLDNKSGKNVLIYERKKPKRESLKYTMYTNLNLLENLNILKQKVKDKYNYDIVIPDDINV